MSVEGIVTALATPFLSGNLDQASFYKLLQDQNQAGITNFVLNSTTGESPTLSSEDLKTLVTWFRDFEKESQSRFYLMIGTGSFSTSASLEKSKQAEDLGADSLLVVSPYYNRPTQKGLLLHYEKLAQNTKLPIFLYNVPSRTSSSLSFETVSQLAEIENIRGIKEASGDMSFFKQLSSLKEFILLSGDDLSFAESIFLGGSGVISAGSNVVPKFFKEVFHRAYKEKDKKILKDLEAHTGFLEGLYEETNPLQIKKCLKLLNIFSSEETRLPLFNEGKLSQNFQQILLKNRQGLK